MCIIALFVCVGFVTVLFVKGKCQNYFVAVRSLPLCVVIATLGSQSLTPTLSLETLTSPTSTISTMVPYCLSVLDLFLILNGLFLAAKIINGNALTPPDVYAKTLWKGC